MPEQYKQIVLKQSGELDQTAVYLWRSGATPRAVVQVIHGMREHMGRYGEFAAYLSARGYAVCGHDHMGHGYTGGPDRVYGHFGRRDGVRNLLRNCRRVTQFIHSVYPETPLFLLGHSMGSLLGRLYVLHWPEDLSGFLCLGTSGVHTMLPGARVLAEGVARLRGGEAEGRLLDRLTSSTFRGRFRGEDADLAWLSRDKETQAHYREDKLIGPRLTNSGYRDLYDLCLAASGDRCFASTDKTLPILLTSGTEDPSGDYGRGVEDVYKRYKDAGLVDVECKLYEGARHELLNEINREEVYGDLYSWMERHLP